MEFGNSSFSIRVRRAVLDASLRSRSDFHTALSEFEDWLTRMRDEVENLEEKTDNMQAMKDTANRKECMQYSRVRHSVIFITK